MAGLPKQRFAIVTSAPGDPGRGLPKLALFLGNALNISHAGIRSFNNCLNLRYFFDLSRGCATSLRQPLTPLLKAQNQPVYLDACTIIIKVYRASIVEDGKEVEVAVKVVHPGLYQQFRRVGDRSPSLKIIQL